MLLRLSSKRGPAAATGVRAVLAGRRRSFLPGMPGAASSSTDRSRTFRSQKLIPFSTETIFNVVAAVDKYDHFLPWCLSSRVLSRRGAEESSNEELQTEIAVGFQMLQARFRSVVEIEPHRRIHAVSEPNKHLEHLSFTWDFEPFSETSCRLDLRLGALPTPLAPPSTPDAPRHGSSLSTCEMRTLT